MADTGPCHVKKATMQNTVDATVKRTTLPRRLDTLEETKVRIAIKTFSQPAVIAPISRKWTAQNTDPAAAVLRREVLSFIIHAPAPRTRPNRPETTAAAGIVRARSTATEKSNTGNKH